jgi:AbrB family looped-hinge helix DNA binding protein
LATAPSNATWARRTCASREVRIEVLTKRYYRGRIKALVTTKGQVTIPKPLREQFGIRPSAEVDFVATGDGIRLRKVVDRSRRRAVLGCLKDELAGRSTTEWLDELRGPVELPPLAEPPVRRTRSPRRIVATCAVTSPASDYSRLASDEELMK